jgi:hypothetical protein
VIDRHDEHLGALENFVIDTRNGKLEYAIISHGGVLGVGTTNSAVPVQTLRVQAQPRGVLFSGDRSKLDATLINRGNTQRFMNDPGQQERIDSQFDAKDWLAGLLDGNKSLAMVVRNNTAWAPGSAYNKLYNVNTEMSAVGTIQSIGVFYPSGDADGADSGMRLRVMVNEDQIFTVHAGPLSSLRQRQIDLRPKMAVTVYGSKVSIHGDDVIMARALNVNGTTYNLRDKDGKPMWVLDDMLTRVH